ncbi:Peptidoglycan-binding lysin domain [Ilyonectria robusta]
MALLQKGTITNPQSLGSANNLQCETAADYKKQELILWNPSLAQNTSDGSEHSYNYPCTVSESVSYCVSLESATPAPETDENVPPSPRAAGEIENCTTWYAPDSYDSCESVLAFTWLEFDDLYHMNPSIKSDCSGLTLGTYYCISTNEDGSPPGEDDSSNPSVKTDCTGLEAKVYVCIGIKAAATTVDKTTSTTSGNSGSTPSPVQDSIVSDCKDFYFVQADDGCWAIANTNGIDLADFYEWNPAVKSDCSGLQANVYVCIGR